MPQPVKNAATFHPRQARYFDQLNTEFNFTADEIAMLERNGFLVTDRLTFDRFRRAYAWIYWKDLPVFVTTDAILHAIHQTYDELLKQVEMTILTQKFIDLLSGARAYLRQTAPTTPDHVKAIYDDLDLYLTVPLVMLSSDSKWTWNPRSLTLADDTPDTVRQWVAQISQANSNRNFAGMDESGKLTTQERIPVGIEPVTLFGLERLVDFTQFRARGHYDEPAELIAYFCAVMWLQLIDFRFVEYDSMDVPTLHREQLIAAHLLKDAIEKSGQHDNWEDIDRLLCAFVGWSDNVTLRGLDRFIQDAAIQSPLDYWSADEDQLLQQLTQQDYGQQRIRGQAQARSSNFEGVLPHHITFALMGQRYTLESDIIQRLVFDKLQVDGKTVPRAYPSPLDTIAALGNNRAWVHLRDEFDKYGYENVLKDLRTWAATHSNEFWQSTFYNLWLRAILTLNVDITDEQYPLMMRSAAWEDKTLHTQLGSWTQLRHDNILYAKPPYSPGVGCEYPGGYVEPYPDFYKSLIDYARFGREVFTHLQLDDPGETLEEAKTRIGQYWEHNLGEVRPHQALQAKETALTYFDHLESTMITLEQLAQKELRGESFNQEDELFLRSVMVRKYIGDERYGGWSEEHWDGWYNNLLPFGDETSQLVADVYTNYEPRIGDVGVLHLGLGDPVTMIAVVEQAGQDTLYVGPAFSYYEHLEVGNPPRRLTDSDWHYLLFLQSTTQKCLTRNDIQRHQVKLEGLEAQPEPSDQTQRQIKGLKNSIAKAKQKLSEPNPIMPPIWTQSFRLQSDEPQKLKLPNAYDDFKAALSEGLQAYLDAIYDVYDKDSRDRSIKVLVKGVLKSPQEMLQVRGVDEAMLNELLHMLREKGHLKHA